MNGGAEWRRESAVLVGDRASVGSVTAPLLAPLDCDGCLPWARGRGSALSKSASSDDGDPLAAGRFRELALAWQRGDLGAQEKLVVLLRERLTILVARRLGPTLVREAGCEDVVQDVLAAVARELPRLDVRSEPAFKRWLDHLVENRIRDLNDYYLRAEKRDVRRKLSLEELRPVRPDDDEHPSLAIHELAPPRLAMDRELLEFTLEALSLLPADQAEAVRRIELEGSTIAQLARDLHVGESTIRYRLSKGLAQIAAGLGEAIRRRSKGGPASPFSNE